MSKIIYLLIGAVAGFIISLFWKKQKPTTDNASGYISNFSLYEGSQLLFTIKGKLTPTMIQLKDTQNASYQLKFVDAKGAETDAASVEVALVQAEGAPAPTATIEYDDPTNTVTIKSGTPEVCTIKITPKDSNGNVLPFADEALEVTAGNAVGGSRTEPVITEQTL